MFLLVLILVPSAAFTLVNLDLNSAQVSLEAAQLSFFHLLSFISIELSFHNVHQGSVCAVTAKANRRRRTKDCRE